MKSELERLIAAALHALASTLPADALQSVPINVERTRDPSHGEYASNVALRLAKSARRSPQELAAAIVAKLPPNALIRRAEVAGAGFINFHLLGDAHTAVLQRALEQAERYGTSDAGRGQPVLLEFVSANPTGPLHVGHGRQAAYGATLASLLAAVGFAVQREYYINDAGRQMDILAASVWLRYLQLFEADVPFPSNGYRGDYVRAIAAQLRMTRGEELVRLSAAVLDGLPPDAPAGDKDQYVDAIIARTRQLLGDAAYAQIHALALDTMMRDIREDLAAFGVHFDRWSSEAELTASGAIARALARLEAQGRLYRKDGAVWFRSTQFGDDEDRVLVRANGQNTYFAPDIAYHMAKRERERALLIDVLGADHHGYVARLRGALMAMGEPGDCLEVCLIQFVSLFRGGEKIPMGKREAQFVTLRQLREEVGNDACRLFYLMRSHDQPLDFDLELAKSRSNENPVYYIQYAHARVASVMKQAAARGFEYDQALALASLSRLESSHELAVMQDIGRYPEILHSAAAQRAPHALVHFLRECANSFHTWYNAAPFIVDDAALRNARLALALGVQQVVRNGLALLGVSAPESM